MNSWKWDNMHEMYLYGTMIDGCGAFPEFIGGKWYSNAVYMGNLSLLGPFDTEEKSKSEALKELEKLKNECK